MLAIARALARGYAIPTERGTEMRTFADLLRMLERQPSVYRLEVEKLHTQDPARFSEYIDYLREQIADSNEREDTPLTQAEVDDLLVHTAHILGWSKLRVLAEGLMRVRAAALCSAETFSPMTPEEPAARTRYMRRHSSLRALVLADIQAAKARAPEPVAGSGAALRDVDESGG